jgi:hypothetical protein
MTAITAELSRAERERLAELADIDRIMREPGTLASPGNGRDDTTTKRRTTS